MTRRIFGKVFCAIKGATAYEVQYGRWVLRVIHLDGDHWRFKPWRRVSLRKYPVELVQ